jgi:hypothetical protein
LASRGVGSAGATSTGSPRRTVNDAGSVVAIVVCIYVVDRVNASSFSASSRCSGGGVEWANHEFWGWFYRRRVGVGEMVVWSAKVYVGSGCIHR